MKSARNGGRVFCIALAAVMLILAAVAWFAMTRYTTETELLIQQHKTGVGALTDAPVTQRFTMKRDGMTAVNAMVSTYNKKLHEGTLTLKLTDAQGSTVAEQTWQVSELRNNAFVSLSLPGPAKAGVYTLAATADCSEQKGVTLRMGPLKEGAEGAELTFADGTADSEGNALNITMDMRKTERGVLPASLLALVGLCAAAALPFGGKERKDA